MNIDFFVKLFKTSDIEIVNYCQTLFVCELPSSYFVETAISEIHCCVVTFLFLLRLVKLLLC